MKLSVSLFALSLTLSLEATSTAVGQEPPPEVLRAAEASTAAFRCAILAALSSPTGTPSPDAVRLAQYALPLSRKFNEWMAPRLLETPGAVGPWGEFLAEVDTDFWVGAAYSNANQWVDQRMTILVPLTAGQSTEDWTAARQLAASAEYASQNCNLIGR